MLHEDLGLGLVTILSWSEFDPDEDTWVRRHEAFGDSEYDIVSCVIKHNMLECDPNVKDLEITRIPKV